MASKEIAITFPVGRLVQGSVYTPNTTNAEGKPLLYKSGNKIGQPRVDFFLGVAIPKSPGATHWANEAWGAQIWALGHESWPQGQAQRTDFAWKIEDGDSPIPNKNGRKNSETTGMPGHWIVKFSGAQQPKVCNADGSAYILEPNAIKCGDYVQVFGGVVSNESQQTAGMYMNHRIVALSGYGEEIAQGPKASDVGFGGVLPVGASAVPLGATTAPVIGTPPVPGAVASAPIASPPAPGAVATASPPPVPGVAAPVPGSTFVAGAGAAPPPPAAAPQHVMTAAAGGVTYEAHIAGGWTDALLVQHGKMLP
jgi:hypothetical protein